MSNPQDSEAEGPAFVSMRVMESIVALLIIALASVYIFDSVRIGFGWVEGQGPGPGFFPFWVSLIMLVASLVNLVTANTGSNAADSSTFVSRVGIWRVMLVLVPTIVYVGLIQFLGIYVASAIFIAAFMAVAREGIIKSLAVGVGVPVALFLMFEKWFLVPLPKGPLEAMLGL
jgi:hypothetical protein